MLCGRSRAVVDQYGAASGRSERIIVAGKLRGHGVTRGAYVVRKSNRMMTPRLFGLISICLAVAQASFAQDSTSFRVNDVPSIFAATSLTPDLRLSEFTLEAWVYLEGDLNQQHFFIETYSGGQDGFALRNHFGTLTAYVFGTSQQTLSGPSLAGMASQWMHVATSFDTTTLEHALYLNGTKVDSTTHAGYTKSPTWSNTLPVKFGARGDVPSPSREPYRLDEVRIWNTVRTASEISDNMNECLEGDEPGLVLYYDFESVIETPLGGGPDSIPDLTAPFGTANWAILGAGNADLQPGAFACVACQPTTATIDETLPGGGGGYTAPSGAVFTMAGTYSDTIPNAAGCDSILTINLSDGVIQSTADQLATTALTVHPNPTTAIVHIIAPEVEVLDLRIVDMAGRAVHGWTRDGASVDVSGLSSGLYLMDMRTDRGRAIRRIVRSR